MIAALIAACALATTSVAFARPTSTGIRRSHASGVTLQEPANDPGEVASVNIKNNRALLFKVGARTVNRRGVSAILESSCNRDLEKCSKAVRIASTTEQIVHLEAAATKTGKVVVAWTHLDVCRQDVGCAGWAGAAVKMPGSGRWHVHGIFGDVDGAYGEGSKGDTDEVYLPSQRLVIGSDGRALLVWQSLFGAQIHDGRGVVGLRYVALSADKWSSIRAVPGASHGVHANKARAGIENGVRAKVTWHTDDHRESSVYNLQSGRWSRPVRASSGS